ncbi:MAG: hypothetical protein KIT17_03835 [Rubrivivax sp.]|nr:hypothetical protein [Rubrivivax sp.]
MAVHSLGAIAPASSSSPSPCSAAARQVTHLARTPDTRARRNHGTFMLGGQLAGVYSARGAGKCYGVSFELGAGTLSLAARMTASQARAMAQALVAAAKAAEEVQAPAQGGAA